MDKKERPYAKAYKDLYGNKDLIWIDIILYGEIESLAKNAVCTATDKYFADLLKVSENHISQSIQRLARLGYINKSSHYDETKKKRRYITLPKPNDSNSCSEDNTTKPDYSNAGKPNDSHTNLPNYSNDNNNAKKNNVKTTAADYKTNATNIQSSIERYCTDNNITDGFREWAINYSKSKQINSIDGLYRNYYLKYEKDKRSNRAMPPEEKQTSKNKSFEEKQAEREARTKEWLQAIADGKIKTY